MEGITATDKNVKSMNRAQLGENQNYLTYILIDQLSKNKPEHKYVKKILEVSFQHLFVYLNEKNQ